MVRTGWAGTRRPSERGRRRPRCRRPGRRRLTALHTADAVVTETEQRITDALGPERNKQLRHLLDEFDHHPDDPNPVAAVAMLTAQLPLPEGIADVPVKNIIKLRTDYRPEFDRFVDALDTAAAELTNSLLEEQDPQIVALHVAHIRRTHFEPPLNDLKAVIKGLKLGTGLGLMNLQTQLPALAAIGGAAAHWPAVTATSIGFGLVGLHHVTAKERDRIRSDSPVTYLLQAEEVDYPTSFIKLWTLAGARGIGINI
ncbi:DUF6236 family protein [Streptomyces sp. NPDC126522]|uniref:DUF6236 family protein n=1 Tax=Streptomyces sp. NPDC126522 TaxID=3155211 RepID=UPI00331CC024